MIYNDLKTKKGVTAILRRHSFSLNMIYHHKNKTKLKNKPNKNKQTNTKQNKKKLKEGIRAYSFDH